jgi:hypothetical protein
MHVLKAVQDCAVLGSVRAHAAAGTCHTGRLIVEPLLQGRGSGGAVLRAIEAGFPGSRQFELFTGSRSAANIRLYQRNGCEVLRTRTLSAQVTLTSMGERRQEGRRPLASEDARSRAGCGTRTRKEERTALPSARGAAGPRWRRPAASRSRASRVRPLPTPQRRHRLCVPRPQQHRQPQRQAPGKGTRPSQGRRKSAHRGPRPQHGPPQADGGQSRPQRHSN